MLYEKRCKMSCWGQIDLLIKHYIIYIKIYIYILSKSQMLFMVYSFTSLGIHASTNDENVVFRDATNKGR